MHIAYKVKTNICARVTVRLHCGFIRRLFRAHVPRGGPFVRHCHLAAHLFRWRGASWGVASGVSTRVWQPRQQRVRVACPRETNGARCGRPECMADDKHMSEGRGWGWMEGWVRVADTHIMSRASYPRNRRCSLAGAAPPILFCANITRVWGGGTRG